MSDELLPCPFCGAMPKIEGDGLMGTHIWCDNPDCLMEVRFLHHIPEKEAAREWNRRTIDKGILEALARLTKLRGNHER